MKNAKSRKSTFWIYYNHVKLDDSFVVLEFGWHHSPPDYSFSEKRDNFLIEILYDGECALSAGGKKYALKKGDAFVIFPRVEHTYVSSHVNPDKRYWISLTGINVESFLAACGITHDNIIFHNLDVDAVDDIFDRLVDYRRSTQKAAFNIYAEAYKLLSLFASEGDLKISDTEEDDNDILVRSIIDFLDANLSEELSVKTIADRFGYDRTSLFRIFKEKMKVSVNQYIQDQRIIRARALLAQTTQTLTAVAAAVGYKSTSAMNKAFVRHAHQTPKQFRQNYKKRYGREEETEHEQG